MLQINFNYLSVIFEVFTECERVLLWIAGFQKTQKIPRGEVKFRDMKFINFIVINLQNI